MIQYQISLGLFDKDTKQQEIATLDASKVVARICREEVGGATITEGKGVYTHKDGTKVEEPTLVISVLDFDGLLTDDKMKDLRNKLLFYFNQESVLLIKSSVKNL